MGDNSYAAISSILTISFGLVGLLFPGAALLKTTFKFILWIRAKLPSPDQVLKKLYTKKVEQITNEKDKVRDNLYRKVRFQSKSNKYQKEIIKEESVPITVTTRPRRSARIRNQKK